MRHATVTMPTQDFELEIAISPLPLPRGVDQREFALRNVNRWRRQIGAEQFDSFEELAEADEGRQVAGIESYSVDLSGDMQAASRQMARRQRPPPGRIQFDTPDGWESRPLKPASVATLAAPTAGGEVTVTISQVGG
jgi:hypothetical protein